MAKVSFNKEKSIGQVVYVVEGDKTEPELIKHIYSVLMDYSVVEYSKKGNKYEFLQGKNKYSRVFIVPALHSAVKSLLADLSDEYFDEIFKNLSSQYELDVENSAVFFLFDRDRKSNRPGRFTYAISKYTCSRGSDDNNEMNGLFLPSYPSVEAFLLQANGEQPSLSDGKHAKQYVNEKGYVTELLEHGSLENATFLFLMTVESIIGEKIKEEDMDNFKDINMKVFQYEDKKWNEEKVYTTLSMLAASFIDLGIASVEG